MWKILIKKNLFYFLRFSILGGRIRRIPRNWRNSFTAVELCFWKSEKSGNHQSVLEHRVQGSVRGWIRNMWELRIK